MLLTSLLKTTRPAFLLLTPACVLLGVATAYTQSVPLDPARLVLIIVGALAAHISVNAINEYEDFRSGLDLLTDKTAFSGGSGALPANPKAALATLVLGVVALLVVVAIGALLLMQVGWQLLPVGLVGALLILTYTRWLNRLPLLCLIAPGLGFGPLMVVGTYMALVGEQSSLALWVSLVPFLLVNNLLLLNQFPDLAADTGVGRRTFPIVYGVRASALIYALFAAFAYLLIVGLVLAGELPQLALLALLTVPLAVYAGKGARVLGDKIATQPAHLAANVMVALLTPVILALTLIVQA